MRKQKGITLIALIITIIVLLILAVVVVQSITGDNILAHAQNAKTSYGTAQQTENMLLSNYIRQMEAAVGGENNEEPVVNSQYETSTTVAAAKTSGKPYEHSTIITDDYGNSVKVPAGFKIATDSATAVTGGIVIEDVSANDATSTGNQFVWIPVNRTDGNTTIKIKTSANDTTGTDVILGRYTFDSTTGVASTYSGNYTEDTSANHNANYGNAIAYDIADFLSKVASSGGYYIGRYEAGDASTAANETRTGSDGSSTPGTLVCKYNQQVYNYITQPDASTKCRNMYSSNEFTSDLMNSYAWDTAIVFIQTFGGTEGSNYANANKSTSFARTGINPDSVLKISDMSGNATEWTTETYSDSNAYYHCVIRGGFYHGGNAYNYMSYRSNDRTSFSNSGLAFRPLLYL